MAKVFHYFTGKMLVDTNEPFSLDSVPETILQSDGKLSDSDWDLCSLSIRVAEEIWFDLPEHSDLSQRYESFIDRLDARMIRSVSAGETLDRTETLSAWSETLKHIRAELK
jgi:hypothetical protein